MSSGASEPNSAYATTKSAQSLRRQQSDGRQVAHQADGAPLFISQQEMKLSGLKAASVRMLLIAPDAVCVRTEESVAETTILFHGLKLAALRLLIEQVDGRNHMDLIVKQ